MWYYVSDNHAIILMFFFCPTQRSIFTVFSLDKKFKITQITNKHGTLPLLRVFFKTETLNMTIFYRVCDTLLQDLE